MVVVQVKIRIGGRDGATARRRGSLLGGRPPSVGVAARRGGLLGGRGSGKGSDQRKRRSDGSSAQRPPRWSWFR